MSTKGRRRISKPTTSIEFTCLPLQAGHEQGRTLLWKGEACRVVRAFLQGHRVAFVIRTAQGRTLTVTDAQALRELQELESQ